MSPGRPRAGAAPDAAVRPRARRGDQAVLISFQLVPFQKPVRPWPVAVLNLPMVPVATQYVVETHSSPMSRLPCPAGGVSTWTLHAEPFHTAAAAWPSLLVGESAPTPPTATQYV